MVAIVHPALAALLLVLVIGAKGVLDIALAVRLRKTMRREWPLALAARMRNWARSGPKINRRATGARRRVEIHP